MPRIVDHEARREELTEALWRVVSRDGVEAASVRAVAAEAGCSPGALRHYFPEQKDLIASAMSLAGRRATARISGLRPGGDAVDQARAYCEQILPMDDERRLETEVWFGFVTRVRLDPELRELADRIHLDLRGFLAQVLRALGFDEAETERLHAFVDGLCLHLLLYPDQLTPERAREQLRTHLARLPRKGPETLDEETSGSRVPVADGIRTRVR